MTHFKQYSAIGAAIARYKLVGLCVIGLTLTGCNKTIEMNETVEINGTKFVANRKMHLDQTISELQLGYSLDFEAIVIFDEARKTILTAAWKHKLTPMVITKINGDFFIVAAVRSCTDSLRYASSQSRYLSFRHAKGVWHVEALNPNFHGTSANLVVSVPIEWAEGPRNVSEDDRRDRNSRSGLPASLKKINTNIDPEWGC